MNVLFYCRSEVLHISGVASELTGLQHDGKILTVSSFNSHFGTSSVLSLYINMNSMQTCNSLTFYFMKKTHYPRQELSSGIVVSGKKICPSGGRAAGGHAFVSGPLCENY